MKHTNFDKIIAHWKKKEQQDLVQFTINKTKNCLSFPELEQYVLGHYEPGQQSHVEICAYCQNMVRLFEKYSGEVNPGESWWSKLWRWLTGYTVIIKESYDSLWRPLPSHGKLAIAGGVLMMILLLVLFIPGDTSLSSLACLEPAYYHAVDIRGDMLQTEGEQLFQQGMALYNDGKYKKAIKYLSQAVEQQPGNAEFIFYLGLCYLLEKQPDQAIEKLQKVLTSQNKSLVEKSYWYLGNAYLLKNNGQQALEMLEKVVEMQGDYQWDAQEMMEIIANR